MNRFWKLALSLAFAMLFSNGLHAQILTPQGRLTLTSNTPVMTSDVTNGTTLYYTPYAGNNLILSTGSTLSNATFTQISLTLGSNQASGDVYDVFAIQNSGTWYLCTGPAWSSTTSRGTGAGTTELTTLSGTWVNANAITNCYTSSSSFSVSAKVGVYLGSIYMTGTGETSMQFKLTPAAGGTSNVLGLYNAYNRVRTISRNIDSASPSGTDSTASWELLDTANSTSTHKNIISFLDGLQQSSIDAQVEVNIYTSSSSVIGFVDVSLDSTTPTNPGGFEGLSNSTDSPYGVSVPAFDNFQPQMGFHYVAAIEYATGSTVTFFLGSGGTEELRVELEM